MGKKRGRKKRLENVDGLGPKDIKRLVTAIRRVWGWNYARKICLERSLDKDGFAICELCKSKTPRNYPDHITPVGEFNVAEFIARMFVPSNRLQAICKNCHRLKTNKENKVRRVSKKHDPGF